MLIKSILISVGAIATAGLPPGSVRADESMPNIAGTYRCEPQPALCRSGRLSQ
jgi:hypothetical protein